MKKEVAFGTSFVSPITRTRSNTVARATRTTRASRRAETTDGLESFIMNFIHTRGPRITRSGPVQSGVVHGSLNYTFMYHL